MALMKVGIFRQVILSIPGLLRVVIALGRDGVQVELGLWISVDVPRVVAQDQTAVFHSDHVVR